MNLDPGHLTDAAARNIAIKALRSARAKYRSADTAGEALEREFDRLIKRKTRINSSSLITLSKRYESYLSLVEAVQVDLANAYEVASQF